jgi:hypothetical protein
MWIGPASEVCKTEFPYLIERGVPFSADDLFVDLFMQDPLYVIVDPDAARKMLQDLEAVQGNFDKVHALKAANVAAMQDAGKAKLKDWYANRDAARAKMAKPAPVFAAPQEPRPRPKPPKQGGEQ